MTGLSLVEGALIGAAAGGLTGGLTDQDTIDLGEPIWAEKNSTSSIAGNQASRNLTSDVQAGLADLGYDPGPVDGKYGPKTKTAIESYQADNGLLTDGMVTPELAAHIGERVAQRS